TVSGYVNDLTVDAGGNLIFCTEQRDVGQILVNGGTVNIIANATTGPFPSPLRGVVINNSGDISVVDQVGDVYRLPAGNAPAIKIYSDLYMISDPTDLLVDATGNFVTASQTPTSGTKALNWISSDGSRWAYYLVKNSP